MSDWREDFQVPLYREQIDTAGGGSLGDRYDTWDHTIDDADGRGDLDMRATGEEE